MPTLIPTPDSDISKFDFDVLWDISGLTPNVKLTNKSVGSGLDVCKFWFECESGGGTIFHQANELEPDADGDWTTINIAEPIPQILGHIEWSGGNFKVKGFVKNTNGDIYTLTKERRICRPVGNKDGQKNNYGAGKMLIESKCDLAKLYIEDRSNYGYNGLPGLIFNKSIQLIYPPDQTGNIPPPKTVNNSNAVLFPIWFGTEGYRAIIETIYNYQDDNGTTVRIKYKGTEVFPVLCGLDLCSLICAVEKLEVQYEKEGCSAADRENVDLIQLKLNRLNLAKEQPLCGVGVQKLIGDIKKLLGINCTDCEAEAAGVFAIPPTGEEGLDCAGVKACLNTSLDGLDPGCLATDIDWLAMSYDAKMAAIIAGVCAAGVEDVDVESNFPYKSYSVLLSFDSGAGTFTKKELRNDFGATTFVFSLDFLTFKITASDPVFTEDKTVMLPAKFASYDMLPTGYTDTVVSMHQVYRDGTSTGYTGFTDLFIEVRVYP